MHIIWIFLIFAAPEEGTQGNYLVAVDINTDKTLWMSKPRMVNSSNFLIVGNSIICGLGGSGIPDYIYAALYDKHVAFKITK